MMGAEGTRGARHWKIKKRDGSRLEPANLDVLRHWVETGQIGPDDHVIHEDLADWILASEAVELDDLFKKKSREPEDKPQPSPDPLATPKEQEQEVNVPDCAFHPGRTASEICVGCGKFICEECRERSDRKVYCKRCLAEKQVGAEPGAPAGPNAMPVVGPGGAQPAALSGLAIASLVLAACGILAFARMVIPAPNIIWAPAVGFVAFLAALLGGLAFTRVGKNSSSLRGRGLALAALALGSVTIAATLAVAFTMKGGTPGLDATRRPDTPIAQTPARRLSDPSRGDAKARETAAQSLLDRAGYLLSENELEDAIETCNQIIRLYPETRAAEMVEQRLPVLLEELARRRADSEAARNRNEQVAEEAYEHAMSMYSDEDRATALALLRNLIAGYPETEAAKKAQTLIEENDKRAEAEKLRKDEEDALKLLARADQLLESERYTEAAELYRRIAGQYPNTSVFADATLRLKEAELLETDPSEREFRAIQREIETMTYEDSIGRIQSFLGKYPTGNRAAEARELLEQNTENKRTADNLYNFGRAHFEEGKYEVAIGRYGKLIQDYPRSRWIAQARNDYEEALRKIEE